MVSKKCLLVTGQDSAEAIAMGTVPAIATSVTSVARVSSRGVIAVDPLPTLGRRYLEAVARVTRQPITHIVYSHEHTDHIGAASLFPRCAAIVAQRETAALLARRQVPRRPVPTVAFDDRYVLGH
jgi:glyoxylase-like metal-dependent hydrolase (beta-lactamase superfamily II)